MDEEKRQKRKRDACQAEQREQGPKRHFNKAGSEAEEKAAAENPKETQTDRHAGDFISALFNRRETSR